MTERNIKVTGEFSTTGMDARGNPLPNLQSLEAKLDRMLRNQELLLFQARLNTTATLGQQIYEAIEATRKLLGGERG